jgi:hypothetical protein
MKGKGLGEAQKLFRARKFPDVIRLLEPEVFRYRESFDYFWLLGFSCLHTGDLGGAFSYISRAHQIQHDDVSALLGIAAIHFRRAENESAIKRWLEVLELQQSNAVARRGLDLLRRGLPHEKLQEFIDAGRMRSLYPPLPPRRSRAAVTVVVLGVLILAGLGVLAYRVTRARPADRPGVAGIEIPADLPRLVDAGTAFPFMLSERDVRQVFQKARRLLLEYRDNLAALEINRLLLSNATLAIKERARMLKGFVTQPTFDTLRDGFSYSQVAAQPALYDGCSVRWKGKVANLKIGKESIVFDLLVGYDEEKELEGIVPVILPFAAQLANGIPIDVLGQVQAQRDHLTLQGISVHRLTAQ